MKHKKFDPDRQRCSKCNEQLTLAELNNLKRNGGICDFCGYQPSYHQNYRWYDKCDMATWLNSLRLDDTIRNRHDRTSGMDLRRSELK